jgi:CPA2 family monovalent cation:H+ antiporter-2
VVIDNSGLLVNLSAALAAAFVGSYIAARLRQSVIIGYILAGLAIGPFTPGFVGDLASVQALADIGVIFLMFAIGVQLSLPELLRVGRIAVFGGASQVLVMIAVGYAVGLALGWHPIEALFLGAVISNSSSTVLSKILGERGQLGAPHGRVALAWSSVQDVSTVVLVVVLSALAAQSERLWMDLGAAIVKALFFLAIMVLLGARVLPRFFDRVAALRNQEVFVGMVAAVALGMAYLSSFFGLSVALGAFVAGVVVAESDLSHQILGEVRPLRDIFSGMFFVAVGMLVDPLFVLANPLLVGAVTLLIVIVKGVVTAAIMRIAGYAIGTSALTGVALAQSAEFSFLLARVGADIGALSPQVFSLMLSGAVLSIVLSPLLFHLAAPGLLRALEHVPLIGSGVAVTADPFDVQPLRRHVVICGFGRVASELVDALKGRGFSYIVIEYDPGVVRDLRARGEPAIYGDASNPIVLEQGRVGEAVQLAVLMSDARAQLAITKYARQTYRRLHITARAYNSDQVERLREAGASYIVQPEFEAGVEVIRHVFQRYGVSGGELASIAARRRSSFYSRDDLDSI